MLLLLLLVLLLLFRPLVVINSSLVGVFVSVFQVNSVAITVADVDTAYSYFCC